ncbi:Neutral ceramidase [Varanus komodoensis]|nr:Neutral ceramidase [Varanus komodoensis]
MAKAGRWPDEVEATALRFTAPQMSRPKSTVPWLPIVIVVILTLVIAGTVTLLVLHYLPSEANSGDGYMIGVGRADCTGPVAEVPFMGYASPDQNGAGIHSRLYCRAFITAEPNNVTKRVVFVTCELGMISQRIRIEVLKQLKQKYGDLYRRDNVILSATHTHSGPAGYFQNTIFLITGKGLIKSSINAIVRGILKSIEVAHENMIKGRIFINKGLLENSQINRSPFSYLHNPEPERLRYSSNTDKEMVVLKMVADNGQEIGMLSWFAIHPVSMNNSNTLTSSDNVGYAASLLEQEKNKGYLPGKGPYVAAFASANLGDVSPNIKGPHCINTGGSCENLYNYCPVGGAKMCIATGPGKDMFESTGIIGRAIYLKAKELYQAASEEINGPISSAHQWVDMSNVTVQLNATHTGKTCKPALGYSFAAGTMDGPGMLNFTQGKTMSGRRVREALKREFETHGKSGMNILLSGLCNVYTHYIATYEEYQVQRYEGASTIFGPHSLSAYIQLFRGLAKAIATDTIQDLPTLPEPILFNISLNFLPLLVDAKPLGKKYGDVTQDVQPKYQVGEVAVAHFVGANPRNSAENMTTFTFLTVEKYDNTSQSWQVVQEDASWDTRFIWQKGSLKYSTAIIEWHIPKNTEPGTYRLQYFGHSKEFLKPVLAFNGSSSVFEVY